MTNLTTHSQTYKMNLFDACITDEKKISFKTLFIHDKQDDERKNNLINHIKHKDYFGTLATILDLIKQDIDTSHYQAKDCKKTLKKIEKDLMYLQSNYKITKK